MAPSVSENAATAISHMVSPFGKGSFLHSQGVDRLVMHYCPVLLGTVCKPQSADLAVDNQNMLSVV